jgi:hypothetical protein
MQSGAICHVCLMLPGKPVLDCLTERYIQSVLKGTQQYACMHAKMQTKAIANAEGLQATKYTKCKCFAGNGTYLYIGF